jgi:hypothetical protein
MMYRFVLTAPVAAAAATGSASGSNGLVDTGGAAAAVAGSTASLTSGTNSNSKNNGNIKSPSRPPHGPFSDEDYAELRDPPIGAQQIIYLDKGLDGKGWTVMGSKPRLSNPTIQIDSVPLSDSLTLEPIPRDDSEDIKIDNVYLPADVLSELQDHGYFSEEEEGSSVQGKASPKKIPGKTNNAGNILYEINWLKYEHLWTERDWEYQLPLKMPSSLDDGRFLSGNLKSSDSVLLVFDGVKMGATISISREDTSGSDSFSTKNSKERILGHTTNQFRRYMFDISEDIAAAKGAKLAIHVRFLRDERNDVDGRFMPCTGGKTEF